jgi:hypothetical protein
MTMSLKALSTRLRHLEGPPWRYSAENCPAHAVTVILAAGDPEPDERDVPLCPTCLGPGLAVVYEVIVVPSGQQAAPRPPTPPAANGRT